jgi:lysophospholipase L1-like esterase
MTVHPFRVAAAALISTTWLSVVPSLVCAQTPPAPQSKWYLAEGATGSYFEEEILIGNPNATAADIRITFLRPGGGTPATESFTMAATSRRTVRVNALPGLANEPALSAVVECTNGLDIVVERSMYWANGTKRGGHNSPGVAAPAPRWFLAEGSTGFFDTFVLIANPDPAKGADMRVTFLKADGTTVAFPPFTVPPSARTNIWVNAEVPALANAPFSTIVESTNGTEVFVERAMYFGGSPWEGGHESLGVTAASKNWFFGEGFTTNTPSLAFDTFLLLSNPGAKPATATVTFLLEGGEPLVKTYALLPTSRQNVWVDLIPDRNGVMAAAPFSIGVESDEPIVAERAMYWGPLGNWLDAHNTPGLTTTALKWAFAEGAEDGLDPTGLQFDSYFLVANTAATPLELRATFVREDATGIVRTFSIPPTSRFTLNTGLFPELSNQRFATFLESTNGVAFAAERAMYWGTGLFGGHGSTGTPWTGPIATPPAPPTPLVSGVLPASGPTTGGTAVTISGTNFRAGSTVTFGGAPATGVVVLNATTIRAVTPARPAGAVDLVVVAGSASTTLANGFTYAVTAPTISAVQPATGPTTGGTTVTIAGINLDSVTGVSIGGVSASSVTVVDAATVRAVTAPHAAGSVDVSVTTSTGSSALAAGAFTYVRASAADSVLAFGDSVTYGTTSRLVTDVNGTFLYIDRTLRVPQPYPASLFTRLSALYSSQAFAVQNSGLPGECASYVGCSGTASAGVTRLPTTITPLQDLVIVLEGVNDLNHADPPDFERIIRNLRTMIQSAKGAGKAVMLGTLTPVKPGEDLVASGCTGGLCYRADPEAIAELNGRIRGLAAEQSVVLVDFEKAFGSDASLLSADGLHPNQAGYDRMAQRVFESMQANFETRPPIVP